MMFQQLQDTQEAHQLRICGPGRYLFVFCKKARIQGGAPTGGAGERAVGYDHLDPPLTPVLHPGTSMQHGIVSTIGRMHLTHIPAQ